MSRKKLHLTLFAEFIEYDPPFPPRPINNAVNVSSHQPTHAIAEWCSRIITALEISSRAHRRESLFFVFFGFWFLFFFFNEIGTAVHFEKKKSLSE